MTNSCVGLKICEGCGALWLRTATTTSVYCRPCTRLLAEFPETKRRHRTSTTRCRRRSPHNQLPHPTPAARRRCPLNAARLHDGGALRRAANAILPHVWAMREPEHSANQPATPTHGLRLVASAAPKTEPAAAPRSTRPTPQPSMAFYRKYTEAVLQRYMSMSLEAGRVPSLLGREMFHGNVSHCKVTGFDDVVHFVHDVGNCLKELNPGLQAILRRVAMHFYDQAEAAALLGLSYITLRRRYAEALDLLTSIMLYREILQPLLLAGLEGSGPNLVKGSAIATPSQVAQIELFTSKK